MTDLRKLLIEVEDVYMEEKAEGHIKEWEEKQRFIQETVYLYIEKINMGRYDKELILEELLKEEDVENYKIYAEGRMVSLKEMLDNFLADKLEIAIRRTIRRLEN